MRHRKKPTAKHSYAARAAYSQIRDDLLNKPDVPKPLTIEEHNAIRRAEEEESRDHIRRLRDEHAASELAIRKREAEMRLEKQNQP